MLSQTKTCGSEMSVLLVEDIKRIKGEMIMSLLEIMEKRRSIRSYTGESIPKGKLETILAAGLLSASGRKRRPWEFIVVQDKETLLKLSKSRAHGASMLEQAGAAIVVFADPKKTDVWTEDCSIAMANMHLMADSLGIGSCWIQVRMREAADGRTTDEYVKELLNVPDNYTIEAILSLGIPKESVPPHDLNELPQEKIHWERF